MPLVANMSMPVARSERIIDATVVVPHVLEGVFARKDTRLRVVSLAH